MKQKRIIKNSPEIFVMSRFPSPIELSGGADCPDCSWPLSLSQPDLDSPERLLGICERCKRWFLIDLIPEKVDEVAVGSGNDTMQSINHSVLQSLDVQPRGT